MTSRIQELLDIGFERVGVWLLQDDILSYSLEKYQSQNNALYAFVVNDSICYIGKTSKTITQRMNGYKKPGLRQNTNIANNKNIRKSLQLGYYVGIFVLTPIEKCSYHGIPVNIAAGIEDTLIARFSPQWNQLGRMPNSEGEER